jgi:hypothetical protein
MEVTMEEELIRVINELGKYGSVAIILYKVLNIIEIIVGFLLIGYGIKKAWKPVKEFIKEL